MQVVPVIEGWSPMALPRDTVYYNHEHVSLPPNKRLVLHIKTM